MPKYILLTALLVLSCRQDAQQHVFTAIRERAAGLENSAQSADDFVFTVRGWKNNQGQSAIMSWHAILQRETGTGETGISPAEQVAEKEKEVVGELGTVVQEAFEYHNDYYVLGDVINNKKANCLGYVNVVYILGKALGLSIEVINVLELHDGKKSYRAGRGNHHAACLFSLSDGSSLILDPAYDLGRKNNCSQTFVRDRDFREEGNYLRLKDDVAAGVHRKIQILDEAGIISLNWFQQGVDYCKKRKWDSAGVCFTTAIKHNPELAEAYNNLGIVYCQQKQYASARVCFRKCLDLNGSHAQAWYNLGNDYSRTGQIHEALESYSRAIGLDSLHARAYYNRGLRYAESGQTRESARDLVRARELDSSLP